MGKVVVDFIRRCIAAGMDYDTAMVAAEQFEATIPDYAPSTGALRQRRYRERHKASQSVTSVTRDAPLPPSEEPELSLPSLPTQTVPQKEKNTTCSKRKAPAATKRCPIDFEPDETVWRVALENGFGRDDAVRQLEAMRDHQFRTAHKDWQAVARNWLRNSNPRRGRGGQQQLSFAVQDAMLAEAESQSLNRYIEEKYGRARTDDRDGNFGVVVALPSPKALSG